MSHSTTLFNSKFECKSNVLQLTQLEVPQILHYVWFNDLPPKQYRTNMENGRKLNKEYAIYLWSDSNTLSEKDWQTLNRFCFANKIILKDLQSAECKEIANWLSIQYELLWRNWARASDILRLAVLYIYGGVYFDTDLVPIKSLGKLRAPLGMLQYIVKVEDYAPEEVYQCNIFFMAAVPHHPIIRGSIERIHDRYQFVMNDQFHQLWFVTSNKQLYFTSTSFLTASLFDVIFQAVVLPEHRKQINFPITDYAITYCDQSWLKNKRGSHPSDLRAINAYLKFIENYKRFAEQENKQTQKISQQHNTFIKLLQLERNAKKSAQLGFFTYRDFLKFKLVSKDSRVNAIEVLNSIEQMPVQTVEYPIESARGTTSVS